jgi:hypothetical protein
MVLNRTGGKDMQGFKRAGYIVEIRRDGETGVVTDTHGKFFGHIERLYADRWAAFDADRKPAYNIFYGKTNNFASASSAFYALVEQLLPRMEMKYSVTITR